LTLSEENDDLNAKGTNDIAELKGVPTSYISIIARFNWEMLPSLLEAMTITPALSDWTSDLTYGSIDGALVCGCNLRIVTMGSSVRQILVCLVCRHSKPRKQSRMFPRRFPICMMMNAFLLHKGMDFSKNTQSPIQISRGREEGIMDDER
jgi:hypothetical protein